MRAAPQNRMVTLIEMSPEWSANRISSCKASTNRLSSTMALVECGTLWVDRIERMPARSCRAQVAPGTVRA